jgi:hypothetical protein
MRPAWVEAAQLRGESEDRQNAQHPQDRRGRAHCRGTGFDTKQLKESKGKRIGIGI